MNQSIFVFALEILAQKSVYFHLMMGDYFRSIRVLVSFDLPSFMF